MTDNSSRSLLRRTFGGAASALVIASILLTPASTLAAGGGPGTPPDLFPDVITTTEETPVSGNVLANDVNSSEVVPFTVTSYTQPGASVGTLVILADGSYTFTPAANFSGSGSATYMASNTKHEVGPAQITINVTNSQDPPVADDDTVTVVEDTATDVKAAILANDADPDGDTISVTGASNATGGSVSLAGGTVTFTPTGELCGDGAGSFDYDIASTGGTDSAHVTVDVTCANDDPLAPDDSATGDEDTDVVIAEADLLANGSDVEGDTLSFSAVSNASGGSVARDGGQITFTPAADLCGDNAASFDYTLSDGNGGTGTGTVTIDLACSADAPVATDDTASGTEDQDVVVTASDLAGNDNDADGDTLVVSGASNPFKGSVSLDAGIITFTPDADVCGDASASFDYTVDDGNGGTDTGTVWIDLACENDNPVADDDTVSADEDSVTDVTAAILANDTDVDGDTLVVSGVDGATGGTVDLTGGVVTFTPDAGQCGDGSGSFDYEVSDGNGGTDSAHATVDVTCTNDVPVATDDDASGTEDQDVLIDAGDLTGNDNDGDGDTLSVSSVTNPSGGTVALDGTTITFSPTANLCGDNVASFEYTLSDGNGGTDTGLVTIDITCVNDAPVADDDTASGTEDQDVVVTASDLATDDTDVEGDSLSVTGASNPFKGSVSLDAGIITFTPDADVCGDASASFDYTVDDGNGGTDTGTVWIDLACENDNPVADDDTASGTEDQDVVVAAADLASDDADVDDDTLSVDAVGNPSGGTVSLDAGSVTFTPAANLCGDAAASFDYTVVDGNGGSDTGTVTIDLTCVNDIPVATDDGATGTEDQDVAIDAGDLTGNDGDGDDDTLSVSAVSSAAGGSVSLVGTDITFIPAANLCGDNVASFEYTLSDGNGGTDTGLVTIDLTCVNDAPVAGDDTATVNQDSGAADHIVLGNDTDVDGDTLTITAVTVGSSAGVVSTDGSKVTFTPASGFSGHAFVTYTVSDGALSDSGVLDITVNVAAVDTTPPTVSMRIAFGVGRVDTTAPLRISWSAIDTGSGVDKYQVQARIAGKPWATIYQGKATAKGIVVPFRKQLVFRVRAWDNEGNRSAWLSSGARKVLPVQNLTTTVIKYAGPWTFVANRASSGGGYSATIKAGAAASWQFNGLQVAYVAPKLATGGFVKVFIDGHLVGRYNLHQAGTAVGRVIARFSVAPGTHTIRVVNAQAGKRTTLDAFLVLK